VGTRHRIEVVVNGERRACETAGRTSLADLLRDGLGLTGTHLGCEHGVCGCCTVLLDGEPVRSCIILAAQADGHSVTTIEGVGAEGVGAEGVGAEGVGAEGVGAGGVGAGGVGAGGVGAGGVGAGGVGAGGISRAAGLSAVQEAFCQAHALQCGYCTPGMVLAVHALLGSNPAPSRADIDEALGGNICRCTGYVQIREAVELAARQCCAAGPPDAS
jgi:aerobic-type carbon monoxide dehydrogenase small subunit (CoxS/CutS family)